MLDTSNWYVPNHRVTEFAPQKHHSALVIPVINEGNKILQQLQKIKDYNPNVDVILVDGGSTDGSTEPTKLSALNVRCLVVKTGPGKLSAQLQCAYAYALKEGYEQILTMDGNGKDSPEGILAILEKMQEGFDYVQGSRYAKGGKAERTPLERAFANKFIHVPLMSFAGRYRFSDTTNGFRGYSRAYLLHHDVQPFRPIFTRYELLFYLTVRAKQTGHKVTEVGVTRTYPDNGTIPTKISGIRSKLAVLLQTVKAAIGWYNP